MKVIFEENMKILKVIWKKKKKMVAKYDIINDVLYKWYIKCCQVSIYPDGAMLKKEALKIKTELKDSNLEDFKTSNG